MTCKGYTLAEIAGALGTVPSAVWYEIKKHTRKGRTYDAAYAHHHAYTKRKYAKAQGHSHDPDDRDGTTVIEHQRTGFRFDVLLGFSEQGRPEWSRRFRWLDESRTEKITMRLLDLDNSSYYPNERYADDTLCMIVPEDLLNRAYYKDFDPDTAPGNRVPAWKSLVHSLDTVMGEQAYILQQLCDYEEMLN